MEPGKFDPRHSGELFKHMDKQNEVLMEAHRSMLHELQKLQVEEEMLMRKLHEVMSAHGLTKQVSQSDLSLFCLLIKRDLVYLIYHPVKIIFLRFVQKIEVIAYTFLVSGMFGICIGFWLS